MQDGSLKIHLVSLRLGNFVDKLMYYYSNILWNFCCCRWRIFRRPIIAEPSNVVKFTKATIALHIYLRTEESSVYCPAGFVDGEDGSGNLINGTWRDEEPVTGLTPLGSVSGNRWV